MWKKYFAEDDIFFVTPDVKRGLGFAGILPRYHIICSDNDPIISIIRKQGANVFCLEEEGNNVDEIRNSAKILELEKVQNYIKANSKNTPYIMFFKPSIKLDVLISNMGFKPIGNTANLNDLFEDKIQFAQFAQREELNKYLVPSVLGILGKMSYEELSQKLGDPIVVQFGHGWAGKTTFFINNANDFTALADKFPHTRVKVSKFIKGFAVLNNCCIYQDKVLVSPPAIQIDGIDELSENPQVTCGRQWPVKFIDKKQVETISAISQKTGNLMQKNGFRGFFGIDFLIEEKSGKIYLSEVNARMTASSAFYTLLESGKGYTPLLAYHLAEFTDRKLPVDDIQMEELTGSQLIIRRPLKSWLIRDTQFGIYNCNTKRLISQKNDYHPQDLPQGEFIYAGKRDMRKGADDEFARIETKSEVLEKPGKLKNWLQQVLEKTLSADNI